MPSGMNSATAPAQLVLNDRSQSTNHLNNTQNVPLGRSAMQTDIDMMQYNNTQILDRLLNQSSIHSNAPLVASSNKKRSGKSIGAE